MTTRALPAPLPILHNRLGLDFHQHLRRNERAHLDHRSSRQDLAEKFTVRPPHLLRIRRANNVHARPHHIGQPRSSLQQRPLDILQRLHRLRVSISHAHNLSLRVRRRSARHPHVRAHAHRPRIPNHRLPRCSARNICSRHQVPPSRISPQSISSSALFHSLFSLFHFPLLYGSNRARNSAGTIGHKSSRLPNTRYRIRATKSYAQSRNPRGTTLNTAASTLHPPPNRRKICKNAADRTSNSPSRVNTTTLSGNPTRRSSATRAKNVEPCSGANRNASPPRSCFKTNFTARWHSPQCPS